MSARHVLLLGGNGKVARLLTPLLLQRSWTVTSVIRASRQVDDLKKLGENLSGKLNVVVARQEGLKSERQIRSVINSTKPHLPDSVVFCAGAGSKGDPEKTQAVDHDAASHIIRVSVVIPSITKFVMIPFITSQLEKAPWWAGKAGKRERESRLKKLERYYQAEVAADQVLCEESKKRTPATDGTSSHAAVAYLTALLLDDTNAKTDWLGILDGDEDLEAAVKRWVDESVHCIEGESDHP